MYTKDYLGTCIMGKDKLQYFVVQKASYYGIVVEQDKEKEKICQMIWFTEEKEKAYLIGQKMVTNEVSMLHIEEIIDDFAS
jgi:hypothetical protein